MTSPRRDRQLGWVTVNQQRYPLEAFDDAKEAVANGHCPFCNSGPFIVVANHVSKVHSLDRYKFRTWLGLRNGDSICDPTHSAACRNRLTPRLDDWLQARDAAWDARAEEIAKRTAKMAEMYAAGATIKAIAQATGMSVNSVRNWLHRHGYVTDARRAGSSAVKARQVKTGPNPERWKTHCARGHEMTPENTRAKPDGTKRYCLQCYRVRELERRPEKNRRRQERRAAARAVQRPDNHPAGS